MLTSHHHIRQLVFPALLIGCAAILLLMMTDKMKKLASSQVQAAPAVKIATEQAASGTATRATAVDSVSMRASLPSAELGYSISADQAARLCLTTPTMHTVKKFARQYNRGQASPDPVHANTSRSDASATGSVRYALFALAEALDDYQQRTGMVVNALGNLDLSLGANGQPMSQVVVNFAGEQKLLTHLQPGQVSRLAFSAQVFYRHSTILLDFYQAADGRSVDPADFASIRLCGQAYYDPGAANFKPVRNDVSAVTPGPGVNVMGSEYACVQGWGLHHHTAAGVSHTELVAMLRRWGVQTVRLPLNEHCWLADFNRFDYLDAKVTGAAYRQSVIELVNLITASPFNGHVVLDLHWTGNAQQQAKDLKPLPDRQFAVQFWSSVAELFKSNPRVMYNLFNEPHVPQQAANLNTLSATQTLASEADVAALSLSQLQQLQATHWWAVWRDGNADYVGMQALVNAVRATGAENPIVLGGLDYAADLRGWSSYAPHDPLGKLWADNHAYPVGEKCRDKHCWQRTLLPIRDQGYGVMFGEAGNAVGSYPQGCETGFVKKVYRFARANDIAALAWTFLPGGVTAGANNRNKPLPSACEIPVLLTRWPGETQHGGDLSTQEINQRRYDPTPSDWGDDATWAGCAALAYLRGWSLDDAQLPDRDPQLQGYGNCTAAFDKKL